jgi:uncharacterized membrane protein YgdD (TMEM256/DUF423 family)
MINISIPIEDLASWVIGIAFFSGLIYLVYMSRIKNKPIQYVKRSR